MSVGAGNTDSNVPNRDYQEFYWHTSCAAPSRRGLMITQCSVLRACLAQSPRLVASTSHPHACAIHTSSVLQAGSHRKRQARSARKANTAKREERQRLVDANRPHVVLGTRLGDDATWRNCDLAKVLIDEETLVASAELLPMTQPTGTVWLPKYLRHGVGEVERKMLFQNLPALSAEADALRVHHVSGGTETWTLSKHAEAEKKELAKTNTFAKVLDLRNASAGGIAYENRRRIITEFSEHDNPFDPGRPEVQAALFTYKIRNLWTHLTKFKRDIGNRRSLRKLVHQRAKILKYLKRLDRDRYNVALSRLALAPGSIEGELVV